MNTYVTLLHVCLGFVLDIQRGSCYPTAVTQDVPTCSSNNAFCGVTFDDDDYRNPFSQICQCPGNHSCPTTVDDKRRVVRVLLDNSERAILSYCDSLVLSSRSCKHEEVTLTARGVGPILFDFVGDIKCTCRFPLTLNRTRLDGMFVIREFACGKDICLMNNSVPPVCERVTTEALHTETEYPCTCPLGYECFDGKPKNCE